MIVLYNNVEAKSTHVDGVDETGFVIVTLELIQTPFPALILSRTAFSFRVDRIFE